MPEKEFNLLHEPWILVMARSGTTSLVSLLEAFEHAHEYRAIAGDLPTQDIAVMRLLLSIMHAVFERQNIDGNAWHANDPYEVLEQWQSLWELGHFPFEVIRSYLMKYEDRFWLFHPETPFYQVAGLIKDKTVFGPFNVKKLNGDLLESDGKPRLFSSRSGEEKQVLSYAEAARWLLHMQGYAETFGKFEAKGKVKSETKAPSIGVGWLGKCGIVMADGNSLFETLMLNFTMLQDGEKLWGKERPVWEKDPSEYAKERNAIECPNNLSELMTTLPRQILFLHNDKDLNAQQKVSEYIFLSGSFFPKENSFAEQFTIWRHSKDPGDDPKNIPFRPKVFDAEKQVWRGFSTFVAQTKDDHRPGIVDWIARLADEDLLERKVLTFKTSSFKYGSMSAAVTDSCSDSLSLNPALLTHKFAEGWCDRIIAELDITEQLVWQLGQLARNIEKSSGSDTGDAAYEEAKRQAYYGLDMIFRDWLEELDPKAAEIDEAKGLDAECKKFWDAEQALVRRLGKTIVNDAGAKAFVGRPDTLEAIKPLTSAEAYNLFLYKTSSKEALKSKGGKK